MTAITRRRLLALGGLAIVGAAGAGAVTAQALRRTVRTIAPKAVRSPAGPPPPAQLVAVQTHEQQLIAALTAAITADPQSNPLLPNLRADHLAHLQAIVAVLSPAAQSAGGPSPAASTSQSAPASSAPANESSTPASAPDLATLRAAEGRAQLLAASASAALSGADAVLLASISACEAGHVELLT
jgi:hypothetical protein